VAGAVLGTVAVVWVGHACRNGVLESPRRNTGGSRSGQVRDEHSGPVRGRRTAFVRGLPTQLLDHGKASFSNPRPTLLL